jgi:hypothetical protein
MGFGVAGLRKATVKGIDYVEQFHGAELLLRR